MKRGGSEMIPPGRLNERNREAGYKDKVMQVTGQSGGKSIRRLFTSQTQYCW